VGKQEASSQAGRPARPLPHLRWNFMTGLLLSLYAPRMNLQGSV